MLPDTSPRRGLYNPFFSWFRSGSVDFSEESMLHCAILNHTIPYYIVYYTILLVEVAGEQGFGLSG